MRLLIQRVQHASVEIDHKPHAAIGAGLLVFVGIEEADSQEDVEWLAQKLIKLRIFADQSQVMNLSVTDTDGELLVVSQFTLHAATKKGNRPSYIRAARPEQATALYQSFVGACQRLVNKPIRTGIFGADMQVSLVNDGPVTIWIDSKNKE